LGRGKEPRGKNNEVGVKSAEHPTKRKEPEPDTGTTEYKTIVDDGLVK
jgi:hypothetical protein